MTNLQSSCKMCGKCCTYEIPITIFDIFKIAKFLKQSNGRVLSDYVQSEVSRKTGMFKLRKDDAGECVFLDEQKKCTINEAKPRVCALFDCEKAQADDVMPWTSYCVTEEDRIMIWEQSIAITVTKTYVARNGSSLNEEDFEKALASIKNYTLYGRERKVKLCQNGCGQPIAMVYSCEQCRERGSHACETPVTLDDIRRIGRFLKLPPERFFKEKIADELSGATGTYKLKRNRFCVFREDSGECSVKPVKPMHCRFTPCPEKTKDDELLDCLFLGSGTVEEQYRHQIALLITREYIDDQGRKFVKKDYKDRLKEIDRKVIEHYKFDEFCESLAPFRYIDDTVMYQNSR